MNKVEVNHRHLKELVNGQRGVRPQGGNQADRVGFIQEFAAAQRNAPRIFDEIHLEQIRLQIERNVQRINPARELVADVEPLDWMDFQEGQ